MSKIVISLAFAFFLIFLAVILIWAKCFNNDKIYVNSLLNEYNIKNNFYLIDFKKSDSNMFDGLAFEAVVRLQNDKQLLDFIKFNESKKESLLNEKKDLKVHMFQTFPKIYNGLSNRLHLFYHVTPPARSTKMSGNVGFLIDEASRIIYIEYWAS
jgi:hypothetical protein